MFRVSAKKDNEKMTVALVGRIDSTNAAAAEAEINACLQGFSGKLVLDAQALEYISSAGLRVILRLKKANPTTSIINASSEVYEIFDMTGFTEMMERGRLRGHRRGRQRQGLSHRRRHHCEGL